MKKILFALGIYSIGIIVGLKLYESISVVVKNNGAAKSTLDKNTVTEPIFSSPINDSFEALDDEDLPF